MTTGKELEEYNITRQELADYYGKGVSTNLSVATIEAPSTDHRLKCHTMSTVKFHKAYVKVS